MTQAFLMKVCKRHLIQVNGQEMWKAPIDIVDIQGNSAEHFFLMCAAIEGDVLGAEILEDVRRIESGEVQKIESDGNAWVAYITKEKVWFEGLYNQGEGGEVSFAQYKRAVETYVRFLSDPERKPIEVEFPSA
jgi:hypothetical protein